MNIGDLYFGFRGDSKQLVADAKKAGEQAGKVTGDAMDKSLSGRLKGAFSDFKKQGGIGGALMGGMGMGVGMGVFGAITSGIGAVTDFMGSAMAGASDLAESLSKSNVVFGEQAASIEKWADTASSSVLLSKQAALEAAGTFGNLFDALGIVEQQSADLSKSAVQLAADLASFNNVGLDEALGAIQSGLLGEAEPMRRFGSNLSAARVEAYALSHGLAASKKQMTDGIKVQARYALMLEDTANAQGDVARTSEGAANQQRRLDAQMKDLSDRIGGMLLGPAQDFLGFLGGIVDAIDGPDGVAPALQAMVDGVQATSEAIEEAATPAETWAEHMEKIALAERQVMRNDPRATIQSWVQGYGFVAEMLGATVDDLRTVAYEYQQAGKSQEEFHRDLIARLTEEGPETLARRMGASIEEVNKMLADRMAAGAPDMQHALTDVWGQVIDGSLEAVLARRRDEKAFAEMFGWGWWNRSEAKKVIADPIVDAVDTVETAIEGMEPIVTVAMERIRNKKGKGWHWKTDISTQLSDLRSQFKTDLKAINFLLNHPGRGAATRSELETQIAAVDKALRRAASRGNLEAVKESQRQLAILQGQLDELDQTDAEARVTVAIIGGERLNRMYHNIRNKAPGYFESEHRAAGGPVTRGMPYTVGERGRETFVPWTDGTIIPNGGGGKSGRIDFYVHDPDGGLARAGITTSGLATALASRSDALSRWED